jgi:hypothetical protein
VVLELSAVQTGARLLPLSLALLVTAIGLPRVAPSARPRLVVRLGILSMIAGTLVLIGGIGPGSDASVVTIPMILLGMGIGALASQLGAVTVSAVPDSQSAEVGGVQNTVTNFGASLGTALVGAVLIGSLTAGLVHGISGHPDIPANVQAEITTQLSSGVPFVSDTDLHKALDKAGVPAQQADAIVAVNASARLDALKDALWAVVLVATLGLFFTGRIPDEAIVARADEPVPVAEGP